MKNPSEVSEASELAGRWKAPLVDLADRIRIASRASMRNALAARSLESVARPVREGVGDTTFGLDVPAEAALTDWLVAIAREGPLSMMTEDTGWRHLGPDERGGSEDGVRELDGFDHGGPRIAVDPVDGTRNLMTDLRSAWTVISFAGPGAAAPRFADLTYGLVSEIPDSRAATYRVLSAVRGAGCWLELRNLPDGSLVEERANRADDDARVDHGYFPFFAYSPDMRAAITAVESDFFDRLERLEGADLRSCFDDQYVSSGGQLALLALGVYRMVVDTRALLATRRRRPTVTAKPYDMAGAALCAQESGCVVTATSGDPLDFLIDTETPVGFAAFANHPTEQRLRKHLDAALECLPAGGDDHSAR